MTTRRSVHIGLNGIDAAIYGDPGTLYGCEADARAMQAVAEQRGFTPTMVLTTGATIGAVTAALRTASEGLGVDDYLFVTYSGHGSQVKDDPVAPDEDDAYDETWCLYDGQLIDDELYAVFRALPAGVRVLVLSDSCHSGSVTKALPFDRPAASGGRWLPRQVAQAEFEANREAYVARLAEAGPEAGATSAAVVLISGCQDNQTSQDGAENGVFTAAFLAVWANGTFDRTTNDLVAEVRQVIANQGAAQVPNLFSYGGATESILLQTPLAD
jgi:hypothetical protein